jgi:hypothetical protein
LDCSAVEEEEEGGGGGDSEITILYSHVLLRGMLKNILAAVQNGTAPIPNVPKALPCYLRL